MDYVNAIYTRQSVDRVDSISIESQVEFCQKEVVNGSCKVYRDKGYSGKNTDRPAFQEMMNDIRAGKVHRVVVYRLDRISRSVLDFARVMDEFKQYDVDFVSTMEKFDTGTPIGKAMLMIVMIFAQLERETIQQRVADAYASRSKRGFYMGGPVPYGFQYELTTIDGIRTKMFRADPEESKVIQKIFEMYAEPQTSLGDIMRYLDEHNIRNRNGNNLCRSRIRDFILNPIYVRADYRVYDFYKSQGSNIVNSPEDFMGTNGAYLYSGEVGKRLSTNLRGHTLVLAPHEGIVDSDTWLKCRRKCMHNRQVAKPVKAKATWLAGKIKCGLCGHSLAAKVYHCKTKSDNRYYLCTNKYGAAACAFRSLDADEVDALVYEEMVKKLKEFKHLTKTREKTANLHAVKLHTRLNEIETEINTLLDKIPMANVPVMEYINSHVAALDEEKRQLQSEISQCTVNQVESLEDIADYLAHWDRIEMKDKLTVVDSLIESVSASEERITITWKI